MVLFWVTITLLNIFAFIVPKKLKYWEMYSTSVFAVMFQITVDVYFDLKWDLYGYFNKGVDNLGIVYEFGIFPAVNIIFLNYWETCKGNRAKARYLAVCCCIAVMYEFMALKSGYLYYNDWKLWYSFIQYPFLYMILVANLAIIRWLHRRQLFYNNV